MTLIKVDHSSLNDTVQNSPVLVVDVWASWCGPCLRFAPVFEAVAQGHPEVVFAKFQLDASEANQAMADHLGVQAVPSLLLFKDGHWVDSVAGALPKAELERMVDQLGQFQPAAQES
ncbi:MAG: thioredoxin family protein [Propionibacteriaceae bacterium]|nr:thioredoxin family protein [Propionibacteriaceae bacterium]